MWEPNLYFYSSAGGLKREKRKETGRTGGEKRTLSFVPHNRASVYQHNTYIKCCSICATQQQQQQQQQGDFFPIMLLTRTTGRRTRQHSNDLYQQTRLKQTRFLFYWFHSRVSRQQATNTQTSCAYLVRYKQHSRQISCFFVCLFPCDKTRKDVPTMIQPHHQTDQFSVCAFPGRHPAPSDRAQSSRFAHSTSILGTAFLPVFSQYVQRQLLIAPADLVEQVQ